MAQSLLTKESPEIRQFFRNIDTLSRLLDIQAEKFRPLLNGDRYMTDSELAGKLKLTRRTLADYRLNRKYRPLLQREGIYGLKHPKEMSREGYLFFIHGQYQNWKICYTTKLKTTKISKNGSDLQQGKTE